MKQFTLFALGLFTALVAPFMSVQAADTCSDGIQNQYETDIDCGRTCGATCSIGKTCGSNSDCADGYCDPTGTCAVATCNDGFKNQDETYYDCGGSTCGTKCAVQQGCSVNADCASDYCAGGVCTTAGAPFLATFHTTATDESITLPLLSPHLYNFTVDWGDESPTSDITSYSDSTRIHTYATAGSYQISITGTMPMWNFGTVPASSTQIISLDDAGDVGFGTGVTDMNAMFSTTNSLTTVSLFDTSSATDMSYMFKGVALTTIPLFDTSSATTMLQMFSSAYSLTNVPLLNTSAVTDTSYMFMGTILPTIPLLDTSSVTTMSHMFTYTSALNTIPLLDTSSVTNMQFMFSESPSLTTVPLLDTSSVTDMSYMLYKAISLTTIPLFDTSSVTNMTNMLNGATSIVTIPSLDARNVINVTGIFTGLDKLTAGTLEGIRYGSLSYSGASLEAPAIKDILDNLGAASGEEKTLILTGNPGLGDLVSDDYATALAKGWTIIPMPPTCDDGEQNQDETGIDIGGVCDLSSGTCSDNIKNQDETAIDCGGAACDSCAVSESCLAILQAGDSLGDGVYWVNPSGISPFQVYCDMTTNGGGWMLLDNFGSTASGDTDIYQYAIGEAFIHDKASILSAGYEETMTSYDTATSVIHRHAGYMNMFYSGGYQGYIQKVLPTYTDEVFVKWGNWYDYNAYLIIGGETTQTLSSYIGASTYLGSYTSGQNIKFLELGVVSPGEIWVRKSVPPKFCENSYVSLFFSTINFYKNTSLYNSSSVLKGYSYFNCGTRTFENSSANGTRGALPNMSSFRQSTSALDIISSNKSAEKRKHYFDETIKRFKEAKEDGSLENIADTTRIISSTLISAKNDAEEGVFYFNSTTSTFFIGKSDGTLAELITIE